MLFRRVLATCLGLAALGCTEQAQPNPITETYNIGVLVPLTGANAGRGPEHLKAMQLAASHAESAGVLKKPIRIIVMDVKDTDAAIDVPRIYAEIENMRANGELQLAGIISSTTLAMRATVPGGLQLQIPHFEIASGEGLDEVQMPPGLDTSYAYALRPLSKYEPTLTADFLMQKASQSSWDKIYVMRGSQAHDAVYTKALRDALAERGKSGLLINAEDVVISDTGPYETAIDAAITAGARVLYWHLAGDANNLAFVQAAERRGYTGKLVTSGTARTNELLHPTDPGVAGYMAAGGDAGEGRFYFAMRGPNRGAALDAFSKDFATFYNGITSPDTFSPPAYDAIALIALGLANVQGNAGPALNQAIFAASKSGTRFGYGQLPEAMRASANKGDIDFDGASGALDLTADPVLGNTTVNRFYMETVVPDGTGFRYKELAAPVTTH